MYLALCCCFCVAGGAKSAAAAAAAILPLERRVVPRLSAVPKFLTSPCFASPSLPIGLCKALIQTASPAPKRPHTGTTASFPAARAASRLSAPPIPRSCSTRGPPGVSKGGVGAGVATHLARGAASRGGVALLDRTVVGLRVAWGQHRALPRNKLLCPQASNPLPSPTQRASRCNGGGPLMCSTASDGEGREGGGRRGRRKRGME